MILKSQAQPTNGAVREYSDWIGSPELIVMMTDNGIRGTGQNYEAESDRWANFRERIAERLEVAKEIIATCSKGVLPSSSHVYELKIGSGCADYSPEGRSDSTPCHIKNELGELGRVSQTAILDLAELSGCDVRWLLDEIPRGDSIEWSRLRRKCENANGSGYSPPLDKRPEPLATDANQTDGWPTLTPAELRTLFSIEQDALVRRLKSARPPGRRSRPARAARSPDANRPVASRPRPGVRPTRPGGAQQRQTTRGTWMSSKNRQAADVRADKATAHAVREISRRRPDRPAACLACGFRLASI